jgi:hypothetical protein
VSESDLHRLLVERRAPALRPMLPPVRALVAVTDTNALARQACRYAAGAAAEGGVVAGLAGTGRSNVFVGAHVPGELVERLPEVAASTDVDLVRARRALWEQIMPCVAVVDVRPGDCMSPRARPFLRDEQSLPKAMRGDPDDVETVAVAEFLAPAVILSADSVFARLGIADSAGSWVETAQRLLLAAGFEASAADAAVAVELAGRLFFLGANAVVGVVRQFPLAALAAAVAAGYLVRRNNLLTCDRLRGGARSLAEAVEPLVEAIGTASAEWELAREALYVVEPQEQPTIEQAAARYLARCGRSLKPTELRDQLHRLGDNLTAAALKRAMLSHPGFVRLPGDRYRVGRPATAPRALPGR